MEVMLGSQFLARAHPVPYRLDAVLSRTCFLTVVASFSLLIFPHERDMWSGRAL